MTDARARKQRHVVQGPYLIVVVKAHWPAPWRVLNLVVGLHRVAVHLRDARAARGNAQPVLRACQGLSFLLPSCSSSGGRSVEGGDRAGTARVGAST